MNVNKTLYKTLGGYKVYIVDGKQVRDNINEEFTNAGQSGKIKQIPKDELWIDKSAVNKNEYPFLADHLLTEKRAMNQGDSYDTALQKADKVEKRERSKSTLGEVTKDESKPEVVAQAHKLKLGEIDGKQVWVVNGEMVRDKLDTDFTEGGHGLVYPYIPNNEIWVDDQISPKERRYIISHETHENISMSKGMKYDQAHKEASAFEHKIRIKYKEA
jgi:hypothetical protein